jgi:hypothetical protein
MNSSFGLKTPNILPYLYISLKLHKEPTRPFDRYLCGRSDRNIIGDAHNNSRNGKKTDIEASTTTLAKRVDLFLQGIFDLLILEDTQNIAEGMPRRIWTIRTMEEAKNILKPAVNISTFDFTSMYTQCSQDEIITSCQRMSTHALKFAARTMELNEDSFSSLRFEPKTINTIDSWSVGDASLTSRNWSWRISDAMKALDYVIRNNFILMGKRLY